MLTADLHTHTLYSHGTGTVEDTVRAAIEKGLKRIGIADHGPKHIFFPVKWEALLQLRRDVDRMNKKYGSQIEVLMGIEANLLGDGLTDVPEDDSVFDYILLGYHKGAFPLDAISRGWTRNILFKQNAARHGAKNAMAYAHAMDNTKKLFAITHPGIYIPVDFPLLAREAAYHGVALEINESHRNATAEDLRAMKAAGAKLIISSDAHRPGRVGETPKSIVLAREAGVLDCVVNYKE